MASNRILFRASTLAAAAALLAPAAQAADIITFPLTNGTPTVAGGKNYSVTVGGKTVNMRVTAWSTNGTAPTSTVKSATVNTYTNGLGVTSTGESTSSPHHTIDNKTNIDFLIFQFDQAVELLSGKLTTYRFDSTKFDSDVTVAYGTTNTAWNAGLGLNNATFATLDAMFAGPFTTISNASTNVQTANTTLFNTAGNTGNIWLVGAAFANSAENCRSSGSGTGTKPCTDGFKLSQLKLETVSMVPEPGTWAMMIFGFGVIGGALRFKRKGQFVVHA